jgi:ABC-type bacteriocin/lantibiotic exporter with double-glycine peptidase domain
MKLLRSPTFYTISLALVGAVFGCVLLIYSQLWLAILSGVITVLLVILTVIAQAYQQYMEQNKNRFQALATGSLWTQDFVSI